MDKKLSLVLGLMIALAFPVASIFAWQSGGVDIEPTPSEFARDKAIDYVLQNHEELKDVQIPSSWETRMLTPEGFCGFLEIQYTGDGWSVSVSNPVVQDPTYTVEIEYTGNVNFHWKGTVDQDGNISVE